MNSPRHIGLLCLVLLSQPTAGRAAEAQGSSVILRVQGLKIQSSPASWRLETRVSGEKEAALTRGRGRLETYLKTRGEKGVLPLLRSAVAEGWTLSIGAPHNLAAQPADDGIRLVLRPARLFAVSRISLGAQSDEVDETQLKLEDFATARNFIPDGRAVIAYFSSQAAPWFLARVELWLPVVPKPEALSDKP